MRWIKHLAMAHADQQVALLLEEHGPQPYGAWWLIIEHIAAPMERDRMVPEAMHSEQSWAGIIHVSRKNVRRIFQILENSGLITTSTIDGRIRIEVRNILKYKDEYSKKSGQAPAISPETPPTQTERDREQKESRAEREATSPKSGEAHGSRLTLAEPTGEMTSFAREEMHWDESRIRSVWATFSDYWRGKAGALGRKSDWLATWRNWCRRERQNQPAHTNNGISRFPPKADFVSDVTEVMQRRVARGESPL
jgi:hypothetical protein